MPQQLMPQTTPVTSAQMFEALRSAWVQYFNGDPSKKSLCLLVAHWAFETAWGRGMWNFNIGNAKSREGDDHDYTFFACTENMQIGAAKVLVAHPTAGHAEIQSVRGTVATVKFFPPHPACRFRAFTSLELGAADYIDLLVRRFSDDNQEKDAWHWVSQGDPVAFCHALKLKGYYTGDEVQYTGQVAAVFGSLLSKPFDLPTTAPAEQNSMSDEGLVALQTGFSQSLADQTGGSEPEGNV